MLTVWTALQMAIAAIAAIAVWLLAVGIVITKFERRQAGRHAS